MADPGTITCPTCGHASPLGTPTCGNCAQDLTRYQARGALASPQGPLAAGRVPLGWLVKPLAAVLVLVGLGSALFLEFGPEVIRDAFEALQDRNTGAPQETVEGAVEDPEEPVAGYDGVHAVAADLRRAGIPCRDVSIDAAPGSVDSGSCRVDGIHVQITVYLTHSTLEFAAREIYDADWPFTYVHDDNWYVTTQLPLARKILRGLGGELVRAPN